MFRSLKTITAFSSALLLGSFLGMTSSIAPAHADARIDLPSSNMQAMSEAPPPPDDPKRKKAGEECKSSDECQRHHTCAKVDGKNICQAPPRPRLPPGAVT